MKTSGKSSVLAAVALIALVGCDQDTFLGGKWRPDGWKRGPNQPAGTARDLGFYLGACTESERSTERCEVFPELVFGHYGAEVVGFARLSREPIDIKPRTCATGATASFPCTRIETGYSEPNLTFDLYLCDGGSRRVDLTRIDSEHVRISISPDRSPPAADAGADGVEARPVCVTEKDLEKAECRFEVELVKTADENQLSADDKKDDGCLPEL